MIHHLNTHDWSSVHPLASVQLITKQCQHPLWYSKFQDSPQLEFNTGFDTGFFARGELAIRHAK